MRREVMEELRKAMNSPTCVNLRRFWPHFSLLSSRASLSFSLARALYTPSCIFKVINRDCFSPLSRRLVATARTNFSQPLNRFLLASLPTAKEISSKRHANEVQSARGRPRRFAPAASWYLPSSSNDSFFFACKRGNFFRLVSRNYTSGENNLFSAAYLWPRAPHTRRFPHSSNHPLISTGLLLLCIWLRATPEFTGFPKITTFCET